MFVCADDALLQQQDLDCSPGMRDMETTHGPWRRQRRQLEPHIR